MTETHPAPSVGVTDFDPMSDEDAADLARMHYSYLLEELDRIGQLALGFAVSTFLRTLIIRWDGSPVGFVSIDLKRYSVELIYVEPKVRNCGIATMVLTQLRATCPRPMALKAPLSPGGEALADRLGLERAHSTPEEEAETQKTIEDMHRVLRKRCTHKKAGDPRRLCRRCYQTGLKRYATAMVFSYVNGVRSMRG